MLACWDDEEKEGTDCALESIEDPLAKHHPVVTEVLPQTKTTEAIKLPDLSPTLSENDPELHDWALEMYEWISLVVVDSPRVSVMDSIDPFLSRYQPPQGDSRGRDHGVLKLVSTTWTGFLPSDWIMGLFVDVLWVSRLPSYSSRITDASSSDRSVCVKSKLGKDRRTFFALSSCGFDTEPSGRGRGYSVLCHSDEGLNQGPASNSTESEQNEASTEGMRFISWEIS